MPKTLKIPSIIIRTFSDLSAICSYFKNATFKQKEGRRQLADYVYNLIEEIQAKEEEVESVSGAIYNPMTVLRPFWRKPDAF